MFLIVLMITSVLGNKLRILQERQNIEGPVLTMQHSDYIKFIINHPRPYTTIVLFTTRQHNCANCKDMEEKLLGIAKEYKKLEVPVFFILVEYMDRTHNLFELHKFESVPVLAISFPTSNLLEDLQIRYPSTDLWYLNKKTSASRLLSYINSKTTYKVELPTESPSIFYLMLYGIVMFSLCVFLYINREMLKNPYFMFVLTIVIYGLCISGIVYNVLNEPSLAGFDSKTGRSQLIHSNQRQQYLLEGYYLGFSTVLGGVALILLYNLHHIDNAFLARVTALFCMLILLFSAKQTGNVMNIKLHGSTLKFFPPEHYIRGPFSNDQCLST